MPGAGFEPTRRLHGTDFKSVAFIHSANPAVGLEVVFPGKSTPLHVCGFGFGLWGSHLRHFIDTDLGFLQPFSANYY